MSFALCRVYRKVVGAEQIALSPLQLGGRADAVMASNLLFLWRNLVEDLSLVIVNDMLLTRSTLANFQPVTAHHIAAEGFTNQEHCMSQKEHGS